MRFWQDRVPILRHPQRPTKVVSETQGGCRVASTHCNNPNEIQTEARMGVSFEGPVKWNPLCGSFTSLIRDIPN